MEDTFTNPRFGDARLALQVGRYASGNTAVQLISADGDESYATLSVNVPGVRLADGDFVFKGDSENEGLLPELLAASRVEVTGGMVRVDLAGDGLICRVPSGATEGTKSARSLGDCTREELIGIIGRLARIASSAHLLVSHAASFPASTDGIVRRICRLRDAVADNPLWDF